MELIIYMYIYNKCIAIASLGITFTSGSLFSKDWKCRMLATIWMYTRLSNCVWVFVEGFYLHTLIFINTFSDKSSIKWFILTGWGKSLYDIGHCHVGHSDIDRCYSRSLCLDYCNLNHWNR